MEKTDIIAALAALAQDNRLDVFRLLVKAGPQGLAAGEVARKLKLPENTICTRSRRSAGMSVTPRIRINSGAALPTMYSTRVSGFDR